ncbi:unnamed protein product [Caenorhabditis auriculariae]|uniref:Uncharacterized protein n=1 Tax=Caenorhabditis auriculariae TaxID=2777116 RepID=A0A8S1H9P6_9PELO|nr:unnamed protein product [Caenorhabditis auriculariae]
MRKSEAGKRRRRNVVTGTLTITDVEKKERPRPEFSKSSNDLCVQRNHAEVLAALVVAVFVVQFAVLLVCLRRCSRSYSDVQSISSGSDTSTFSFSPASSRTNIHCSTSHGLSLHSGKTFSS